MTPLIGLDVPPPPAARRPRMGDIVIATLRDRAAIGSPAVHCVAVVTELIDGADDRMPIASVLLAGATLQSVVQVPDLHGRPVPFPLVSAMLLTYDPDQSPQTWTWPEDHAGQVVSVDHAGAH